MGEAEATTAGAPSAAPESTVVAKALNEAKLPSSDVVSLAVQQKEEADPGTTLVVEGELLVVPGESSEPSVGA
eukprot:3467809-Lingulodinium_polyedra.AAC.1